MITSHFAVRKDKGQSTRRGNLLDFILEGGKLKEGHTSEGESLINPKNRITITMKLKEITHNCKWTKKKTIPRFKHVFY